jgi:Domain of unknown function (DUF4337)
MENQKGTQMSEHGGGVHVHAPHEELVEHGAHGAHGDGLSQKIALTTAVLATIGALFGYYSGKTASEAMMAKNDSIALHTQASDQWAFYQAKSTREFLATNMALLATDEKQREKLKADAERYNEEKKEIEKEAKKLVEEARHKEHESDANLHPHERMSLGTALMQVAVALSAITLLTKKNWLYMTALAFAAVGIGIASWGALAH